MQHIGRNDKHLDSRIKHVSTKILQGNYFADQINNTYWSSIAEDLINFLPPAIKYIYIYMRVIRKVGPICSGCRIHRLQRSKTPPNDTKQSDIEASVMLELWGMRSTPSMLSLQSPLWFDMVLSIGQIELLDI